MSRMTIQCLWPPSASARRNSWYLWTQGSPARISGRDSLRRLWLTHKPYRIGQRRPTYQCQADHVFWQGACKNWRGWWNLMWPLWWCHPGGCHTLREVPGRMNLETHPSKDPGGPYRRAIKGLAPAEISTEESTPPEEPPNRQPLQWHLWRRQPLEEPIEEQPPLWP